MVKKNYIQPTCMVKEIDGCLMLLAGSVNSVLPEGLDDDDLVIDPGVAPMIDGLSTDVIDAW